MNKLFLFVEGAQDKIFAERVLTECLLNKSINLIPIPYVGKPQKIVTKIIKSSSKHNYLFLSDLDINQFPCITSRKENRFENYDGLSSSNIIIVKEEIESWYLAGINTTSSKIFKDLQIPDNTEGITKEMFEEMIDGLFDSKNDCLVEIAKNYDFELAKSRNSSFKYFLDKLDKMF